MRKDIKIYFVTADQLEKFSGSMIRAQGIVEALIDSNYDVKHGFFSEGKTKDVLEAIKLKQPGFYWEKVNWQSIFDCDVVWLSHFWSNHVLIGALRIVDQVRRLKPQIKIVADLCDVILSNNSMLSDQEKRITAYLESILVHSADCVVYVSEDEAWKAERYYGIDKDKLVSIPIPFRPQVTLSEKGFDDRPHEVCMAGSSHPHNQRAFNYALDSVWPLIASRSLDTEIHVFGQHTDKLIFKAKNDGTHGSRIRQFGEVPNLQQKISDYKMQLVTTVTGDGVKTKILDCLATGTPIVGTAKSVEGMGLDNAFGIFVSEDPCQLADWCIRLGKDEKFWLSAHEGVRAQAAMLSKVDNIKSQCVKTIELALSSTNVEKVSPFNQRNHILVFSPRENSYVGALQKLVERDNEFQICEASAVITEAFSNLFWVYHDSIVSNTDEDFGKKLKGVASLDMLPNQKLGSTAKASLSQYQTSYGLMASAFDSLYAFGEDRYRALLAESDIESMNSMLALTRHYRNSIFLIVFEHPFDQWASLASSFGSTGNSLSTKPETFITEYARLANLFIDFYNVRPARTVFIEGGQLADPEYRKRVAAFAKVKIADIPFMDSAELNRSRMEIPDLFRNIFENSEAEVAYGRMKTLSEKADAMISFRT